MAITAANPHADAPETAFEPETRVRDSDLLSWPRYRPSTSGGPYPHWAFAHPYDELAAGTSQFISRDPAVAATRSPYGYAGESPLNATDPMGLGDGCSWYDAPCHAAAAARAAAGAAVHAASWVGNHKLETAGFVLGAAAAATGVGAFVEATVVIGSVTVTAGGLSAISLGAGTAAAFMDAPGCKAGDAVACIGLGLGLTGAAAAIPDLIASMAGLEADTSTAGAALKGLSAFGLNVGFIGTGADAIHALLGSLAGSSQFCTS